MCSYSTENPQEISFPKSKTVSLRFEKYLLLNYNTTTNYMS